MLINSHKNISRNLTVFFKSLKDMDYTRHPLGYVVFLFIGILSTAIILRFGTNGAIVLVSVFAGIPLAYSIIAYPKFGIITFLVCCYFIMTLVKVDISIPFGTIMDVLELLLLIGFFIHHKINRSWSFAKNSISLFLLLWVIYNVLQVFNPLSESVLAWVYTIRSVALITLTYFVFLYYVNTIELIRLIIKIWIGLSLFAALYCFKQEFFGFFNFEKSWLALNPSASNLYFIAGHWRKFSIFSDPVASAYNMVVSSLLCITLMFSPISIIKKFILGILAILFMIAMLYTGTRGAFILIPAGLSMLFLLKFSRKILLIATTVALAFFGLVKLPIENATIKRFQSAFNPDVDASYNVRKVNQKKIQPYIQSHPIGGGLGATGTWGQRFSPNSFLASFPPDSGFVRVAVETGWIGLMLICSLLFVVLRTGIINYFKINNPELKTYCLAMIVMVFALTIGNFPQEALVQFPINIYFYLILALISQTMNIDGNNEGADLLKN